MRAGGRRRAARPGRRGRGLPRGALGAQPAASPPSPRRSASRGPATCPRSCSPSAPCARSPPDGAARPRPAPALRGRRRGDDLGRDRRAVRGRGARLPRAHVPRLRPPLRARPRHRAGAGDDDAVRGRARRRAGVAPGRHAVSAEPDPDLRGRRAVPHRVGLVPRQRAAPAAALAAQGRAPGRPRGRLAARARRPHVPGRPGEWPHALVLLGDQVYADEVSPEVRERIRAARDREHPAGRDRGELRGVHAALPRVVGRAAHPLAAVDGADGDDLRRPRRPRRLEHVAHLGRRRCARPAGGTSASSAASPPTGSTSTWATCRRSTSRRTRSTPWCGAGGRRGPGPARVRLPRRPRGGGHALELLPRLRPLAAADDRLARRPRARPARGPLDARPAGVGVDRGARGGRLRPPADRHVAAVPARTRPALPRGLERGGLQRRLGGGRGAARRADPPGGRPRALGRVRRRRSTGSGGSCATSARARSARRPRRSSGCRATSTTRTSPRSASRAGRACAPRSTRRPARRSATRSTRTSGA